MSHPKRVFVYAINDINKVVAYKELPLESFSHTRIHSNKSRIVLEVDMDWILGEDPDKAGKILQDRAFAAATKEEQ